MLVQYAWDECYPDLWMSPLEEGERPFTETLDIPDSLFKRWEKACDEISVVESIIEDLSKRARHN